MYDWSLEFASFSDACAAHGCDTPEQLAAEAAADDALWAIESAEMEAAFGPYVYVPPFGWDGIPF